MVYWIRRISKLLAFAVFFLIFFNGISYEDPFNSTFLMPAFVKAIIGAALFWVAGFIVSDIILKGIIEDIPKEDLDILEGGIIQRMKQYGDSDHFNSVMDDPRTHQKAAEKKKAEKDAERQRIKDERFLKGSQNERLRGP